MTVWWSTQKINATLNQDFVERELGTLKNRQALHRVLQFGDGLTDDTYLDWVLERSPRFFLTLNDIGCPEKIFDIIDRSFDDEDLPLSQDALWELNLFGTKSETLDRKFYRAQYNFLVQELETGGHVDYGTWEAVPVEPVRRAQIGNSSTDRVYAYDHLYTRKKIAGSGENGIDKIHFMLHLKGLAAVRDPHLVTVFATYSQDDFNYVLLTPTADLNLRQVLDDQSKQFKLLDKSDRREIVLTWAHCITSALAYLHQQGLVHRGIRPSNIVVDQNSKVYLTDYHALKILDRDDGANLYKGELYEHSPPEHWLRKSTLHEIAPLRTYLPGGSRTTRRLPKSSTKSDMRPPPSPISSIAPHSASRSSSSGSSTNGTRPRNALITTLQPEGASDAPVATKQCPADVFSLSTVLATLLSYLLGHSPKAFASHRCRINRQAGRGNAPPDSSFHKNLSQVEQWMNKLAKEAGQKEKKDVKFWGAVAELIGICKQGMAEKPGSRPSAAEMEKKVGGWVEWGLGRRRRCTCHDPDVEKTPSEPKTEEDEEVKPRRVVRPPKATSERISYINQTPARYWTTVSEDVSTARNSLATVGMDTPWRRSMVSTRSPPGTSRRHSFLRDSMASGTLNGFARKDSTRRHSRAHRRNSTGTEVWGLPEALKEEDEVEEVVPSSRYTLSKEPFEVQEMHRYAEDEDVDDDSILEQLAEEGEELVMDAEEDDVEALREEKDLPPTPSLDDGDDMSDHRASTLKDWPLPKTTLPQVTLKFEDTLRFDGDDF